MTLRSLSGDYERAQYRNSCHAKRNRADRPGQQVHFDRNCRNGSGLKSAPVDTLYQFPQFLWRIFTFVGWVRPIIPKIPILATACEMPKPHLSCMAIIHPQCNMANHNFIHNSGSTYRIPGIMQKLTNLVKQIICVFNLPHCNRGGNPPDRSLTDSVQKPWIFTWGTSYNMLRL